TTPPARFLRHCDLGLEAGPPLYRPRSRHQPDRTVLLDRQHRADPLAQYGPASLVERHGVARSRSLPAQERTPEVVKVSKDRGYIDRPCRDLGHTGLAPQRFQAFRPTDRK